MLASITGIVAEGIRASLRFDAGRRGGAERTSPGLMLLGPRNEVEMITPPARELLDLMSSGAHSGNGEVPPNAVLALAEYTRRGPAGDEARTVAVPTGAGWITLHASLPDGSTAGRVAIVVERSASPAATAVRLEAHGVTAREREIAGCLAAGLTNSEIAAAARPVALHRPGPHQEPAREDRRLLTSGARRAHLPRRLSAPHRRRRAARQHRPVHRRLTASSSSIRSSSSQTSTAPA